MRKIATGLRLLALLAALVTLEVAAEKRPIRFEALSLEQGLSQATVNTVFQDSRGFLWIGTEDGLNRYDGYDFTVYKFRPEDPTSLPADAIWTIQEDTEGRLLIATEGGGVARWSPATDLFEALPIEPPTAMSTPLQVRTSLLEPNGTLWLGTRTQGLWRIDTRTAKATVFSHEEEADGSLPSADVFAIARDSQNQLWVGTEAGLVRLDPSQQSFVPMNGLADPRVRALRVDGDGALWIGTYGGGVARLAPDGTVENFAAAPDGPLPHARVRAIFEDSAGRIWIGTAGGLCLFDRPGNSCATYSREDDVDGALTDSDVTSIIEDRSGVLWFGTRSGGLHRWHPRSWRFGHMPAGGADALSHGTVTGFAEDRTGRVWIATLGGGLNRLDRDSGIVTTWRAGEDAERPFPSDFLASLLVDPDGTLWVGSFDQGLLHVDATGEVLARYPADSTNPQALGAEGVTSLVMDKRKRIWVGTFGGGLHRLDRRSGTFERFGADQGLTSPRVLSLTEGADGNIWIGTEAGGLHYLNPATGTATQLPIEIDGAAGLPTDTIFSLYGGDPETLWIGTRGAGLVGLAYGSLDGGSPSFRAFGEPEGFANDVIYGIQPDTDGNLWLSTNVGLVRFNAASGAVKNYTVSDGLQSMEFTFGGHFRSRSGDLFFGGVNGINVFTPAEIEASSTAPPMTLTSVSLMGLAIDGLAPPFALERLDLDYRDDVVSLEFSALDYSNPRANRYAYRLEGFNRDWIDLGDERRVTFTDLDGGNYTLHVKAANPDGIWNESGLSLPISVATPPWQTPWAYLLYVFIIAGCLLGYSQVQRNRLAREAAYSRRLEDEVRARTRELRSRNEDLETLNVQLREASLTDALTGLRNRRFLAEHINEETSLVARRYHQLSEGVERIRVFDLVFLIVDLDRFKGINDTCGHLAGDEILLQMRDLLLHSCRQSDILVRWGGDEFLVVARDANPKRGEEIAHRIRTALSEHVFIVGDSQSIRLTCSIGFACFPFVREEPDLLSWNDVLMLADTALYAAKASGRDAWVGVKNTAKGTTSELPIQMRHDPAAAVAEGLIEVTTSIEDLRDIQWKQS